MIQEIRTGRVQLVHADYSAVVSEAPGLPVVENHIERGRDFDRSLDKHVGAPHEVIISYALWQHRFNADPSAIGRSIDIDREPASLAIDLGSAGNLGLKLRPFHVQRCRPAAIAIVHGSG